MWYAPSRRTWRSLSWPAAFSACCRATASFAARYHDPLSVGIGPTLALWVVAGLAIAGGRGLLKIIPLTWISRIAAAIMLVLAGISLAAAIL